MPGCIGLPRQTPHGAGGDGRRDDAPPAGGGAGFARNWLEIIFVACCLGGWTIGILWTQADWLEALDKGDAEAAAFDRTWLMLAIAVWIATAAYLLWLLFGGRSLTGWWASAEVEARLRARNRTRGTGAVQRNWFMILFIGIFLIVWTTGVIAALGFLVFLTAIGELGMALFLVFWLIAAIVGWFVVFRSLKYFYGGGSAWTWNPWSGT